MTANLFAALLDGVTRYSVNRHGEEYQIADGEYFLRDDVLDALAAAVSDDLAEAGKVADELREVSAVFTKDAVFKDAADLITALLARIAAQEAQMAEWQASQHYRYIGADGQPVLARDLEARAEAAETALAAERAKTAKLVALIEEASLMVDTKTLAGKLWDDNARAAITEAGQ